MDDVDPDEGSSGRRIAWFDRIVADSYGWTFGGLLGGVIGGPVGGIVGAAGPPLLSGAAQKVLKVGTTINTAAVGEVFESAAAEMGQDADSVAEDVTRNPDRLRLTMSAMQAALNTYNEEKLHALARILAEGLLDDARLDASWLVTTALSDLETPHVHVLYVMQNERHAIGDLHVDNWGAEALRQRLPNLRDGIDPLLATLQRHGLVEAVPSLDFISWRITDFGRTCLIYLSAIQPPSRPAG